MKRTMIMAAAVVALIALSAPAPAQANMANPALGSLALPLAQNAQFQVYIGDDRRYHRRYRRHHDRYRHCWNRSLSRISPPSLGLAHRAPLFLALPVNRI